jgi:hypothetical protein
VADVSGVIAGDHTTDADPEGYCFLDLQFGNYNVSAAVPPDHNPTTAMNLPISLNPGDRKFVQFGAQPSSAISNAIVGGAESSSLLLGLLGAVLLIGGIGLGVYASRLGRKTPRSLR